VLVLDLDRSDSPVIPSDPQTSSEREPERYEPLPGLTELPAWLWRRAGRGIRIVAGLTLAALIALGIALAPGISDSKRERARAEQRERAEHRARLVRRLEAEQRPRTGRSSLPGRAGPGTRAQLAARAGMMEELAVAIEADARRRVRRGALSGPIRRVECERFPRTIGGVAPDEDLSRRRGRYACVAVTSEFERGEATVGGVIGHQYRVLVDFATGRYAYCKVSGQSGPTRDQLVTTPRACGGR
jgi:hypothetical protein